MYLDFSLWEPVKNKMADFRMMAITDQQTTCTLDFGDSKTEQKTLSPGLTNQHVIHTYQDAGNYDVICKCPNVTMSLFVTAKSNIPSAKLKVEYYVKTSIVDVKLEVKSTHCLSVVNCDIYFEKQKITSVTVSALHSGFSQSLTEPGFHNVAVKCLCSPEILYMEETIHVYDPCFEEYFFRSFPWTSEQKPFEIYENSHLLISEVSKPIKCKMNITSREWKIKKKIGTTFEAVNWTFSDQATFPEDASFGLYSILLNVTSGQKSHFDTLYLLYKKIIRPLQIHGGSIQFVDPSQKVRLFEDEKQNGVYYLWCYHKNAPPYNINKPLFIINLEGQVNCGPFTKNNSFTLPASLTGPNRLVQVFAIMATDFREGRSFLSLTPVQQKKQVAVNIRCIYNCDGQVSAKINWVLQLEMGKNSYQNDSSVTYEWTIYTFTYILYTKFTGQGNWIEGSHTPALTIIGGSLPTKTWLKVCAEINSDSVKGFACNEVFCGSPPSNGKCTLSSSNGIALETKFIINCTGYVDDGIQAFRQNKNPRPSSAGIRYAVLFKSGDNLALIYYGIIPQIGPFYLGTGDNNAYKANLYIRVYDIYYSFENITVEMTVTIPSTMFHSLDDIEKYLLSRISNIDHLPRQDQFNVMNSVSGVVNKMITKDLLELIEYDVNDMTHGKFIDFDLKKDVFKSWEEMMILLKNHEHKDKVKLYSKIIKDCVEKTDKLLRHNDNEIGVLSTLGTLNLAVSYHPYVSQLVMKISVKISRILIKRALQLCQKPIISIFMTDIADCGEIMLGRLMSVINTGQIVLASEGFAWDTVRKYMEKDQVYVKAGMIDTAMRKSEIDEFERFYLLQKTYLLSNVGINEKREQAQRLSSNLVDYHLYYLKMLIDTISATGRKSKSQTGTSVCAKKTAGSQKMSGIGCGQMNIQIGDNSSSSSGNVANIQALATKEKLFTYDKDMRSSLISQPTMILKMGNDVKTNRSFVVKFGNSTQTPSLETPKFVAGDQARLFYHRFIYRSKTDYACVRLTPALPALGVLGYEAYFRLLIPPNNDSFHYRTAFSRENLTDGHYQFCVPPGVLRSNGSLFVGFRPFFPSGVTGKSSDLLVPYSFEAISANCIVWVETAWSGNICRLIWTDYVACKCFSSKQVTVSNTFFVPPNVIDFSTVFTKFDIINNGTVFSVVLGIFLLFVIIFVIALRQDRKEEQMGHFRSLSDNYKDDSFYYLLIVYTGLKIGAGTQSNICFLLSGERATSGVRSLSDEAHKGFKSGSVRKFVMCTPSNLGDLLFLKIWTDGSGIGEESSWFLDRFEVMEVNSEKKFIFRCNAWLTTDESGRPLYILPCNRFQDEMTFSCRFKENMYESMTDGHLWFSAYMRPCYGQFTRAQRVICCALVLYLTMIVNAMFYRSEENLLKPNQITLGPLRFSLSQIAISLQSIAITLPPTFLVLIFFKNSKPPKYRPLVPLEEEQQQKIKVNEVVWSAPSEFPGNGFLPHWCVYIGWLLAFLAIVASGFFVILFSMQWGKTKSEEWMTTFLLSSGESLFLVDPMKIFLIAFIIAFLKKEKRELKLTYLDNMSILQEIYNILYKERDKPAKFSVFRPMGRQERIKRQRQVENEIWMRSILLNFVMYALLLWTSTSLAFTNRTPYALLFKDHLKKTFADPPGSTVTFSGINSVTSFYQWTRNIVYPALFPVTDYTGNRLFWIDKKFINDGVNMKIGPMRLRQLRLQNPENCSTYQFIGIRDCYPAYSFSREEKGPHCLRWKEGPRCGYEMVYNETLVAWSYTPASQISGLPTVGIYSTYSGGGYIMNIQVNPALPVLRLQMRRSKRSRRWDGKFFDMWIILQTITCFVPLFQHFQDIDKFHEDFIESKPKSFFYDGIHNLAERWCKVIESQVNNYIANEIQDELIRAMWIDRKTRAVFLEFTLYNANSNQFANFFFLVEFPESGGAIPYYQINVITAYNSFDPYTVACLVTFVLCFIMFMIKNVYNLLKERTRFFKNFWNLVDLCAFLTTSSASVAYTMQYFGTQAVLEQFRVDPRIFVNFYHLVVWNQIITYNLAFQIFFTIIRVSCILGISQRMSEIAAVMKRCVSELIGVFCIFSIYALAFMVVGNLCFTTTSSYHSYGSSLISIFLLLLGKNNFAELVNISPIIGKIYFTSKIFFMIFIILKMFESVLSESISSKKKTKVRLSLLELFMRQLKISRMVHVSNPVRKKNEREETEVKEDKF